FSFPFHDLASMQDLVELAQPAQNKYNGQNWAC
ncbi:hypothetical protein A2U01_0050480, partial [Trifolium medium]|nr:hypothetical protein [Trifolium medium]